MSSTLQFTPEVQGFAGVAKNFKAPGNFEYFSLAQGVTFTNGVGSSTGLAPLTVKAETSTNLDVGLRFRGDAYRASATAFLVKFKDRIASSYDPNTGTSHDWNVGDSTVKGMELEAGTVPVNGFSAYTLPSDGFFKNPVLRFNVSNLTNKQFLTASLGSGSSIAINAAGNPYVYPGAPRFFSVTGQADF